jgi:ribosomal protein S18 acetylase RimI-like enzyme
MAQAASLKKQSHAGADLTVRPARAEDIPALVAIEEHSFPTDRLSRRSFQYLLTKAHAISLVAEAASAPVGYVIVLLHAGTSLARLYSIAVDPAWRGHGFGAALLAEAERRALDDGCAFMRLEVRPDNVAALAQYRGTGYREIGFAHDYYEDHSDALRMEKALAGGDRPELARVPYYAQTLEFTCGPAALMMAMKALDPGVVLDRKLELRLWRESTTIYMTSGHGGCGPEGLALAAVRRGFRVDVFAPEAGSLFVDSVRSAEKKEVIRLVEEDFRDALAERGTSVIERGLSGDDLVRFLRRGAVPIVLISSYRLYGEKAPHWVVVTGYDDSFVFLHDPYVKKDPHRTAADSVNVPVGRREFDQMARYGSARLRAAVIVKPKRKRKRKTG